MSVSQLGFLGRAASFAGVGWIGQTLMPQEYVDRINHAIKRALPIGEGGDGADQTAVLRQLKSLGQKVEGLSSSSSSQQPSTIVLDGRSSGSNKTATVILVGLSAYVYARFWLGWTLSDFAVVSRASLDRTIEMFSRNIESVTELVSNVREAMAEKIQHVKDVVDRVVRDVRDVHDDLRNVQQDVDATRSLAESCDKRIAETSAKQDYANRGIHALCSVVGELLQNAARTPAIENLRSFTMLTSREGDNSIEQIEEGKSDANIRTILQQQVAAFDDAVQNSPGPEPSRS